MRPSFNVATQPWIPVTFTDGQTGHVALQEALLRAHAIREVSSDAPVQVAAIYRLLLALFLRIFPESIERETWWKLWKNKSLPDAPVRDYFTQWIHRFELFDERFPFMQHPHPLADSPDTVNRLFHERASGNNPTLFDHSIDWHPTPEPPERVVPALLATQAAALGGGRSSPFYLSHAPLIQGGALFWIRGRTLFEALLLNAPPIQQARIPSQEDDRPLWEHKQPPDPGTFQKNGRPPRGYLDYLTVLSRMVRLEPQIPVRKIWYNQGDKLDVQGPMDPLMAYTMDKTRGWVPLRLQPERVLWRDSHVILGLNLRGVSPPRTFQWLTNASDELAERRWDIDVFGMSTDQAKIYLWRQERFPLHVAYLQEPDLEALLQRLIDMAEMQSQILSGALRETARWLCFPEKESLTQDEWKDVRRERHHLWHLTGFWPRLEDTFYACMLDLAEAWSSDGEPENILEEWRKALFSAARDGFEDATRTLVENARQLKARALGRARLYPVSIT